MFENPFIDHQLLRLHRLIRNRSTGTQEELARRFNCSKRNIAYKIEKLRDAGLPVAWSPEKQSYYYESDVSIKFSIELDGKEMKRIVGGSAYPLQKPFEEINLLMQNNCIQVCDLSPVFAQIPTGRRT